MEQINLNIIPDGVMPVCHASQFDKNRTIRFNLKDNGSVYTLAGTETITCTVRKPDDTENTINVANTSSSYVDVTFGFSDTDLSGYAMCELKIVKGTQTIGSRNFLLNIEADAFDGSKFEERSASGAIASFETNYIDNLNELIVNITSTQAGSGTPSPSNPRSISGWSSCDVVRCGKNFFDISQIPASGTVSGLNYSRTSTGVNWSGTAASAGWKVIYEFTFTKPGTYHFKASNLTTERLLKGYATINNSDSYDFEVTDTTVTYRLALVAATAGTSYSGNISDIQITYGAGEKTYEPYNGTTYTISLGDTYYGGTLNVTTGELTVTRGYVDMGSLTYTYNASSLIGVPCFLTNDISDAKIGTPPILCSALEIKTPNRNAINGNYQIAVSNNTSVKYFVLRYDEYTDGNDVKTALSGVILVYELDTPTTVQLTPTEVRTLLEDNNIFADTGDVVSCKYLVEVT